MSRISPLPVLLLGCLLAAPACSGGASVSDDAGPEEDAAPSFVECEASDQAFVRQAYLAIRGHRPRSQAEVQVYVDLMRAVRALGEPDEPDDSDAEDIDAGPMEPVFAPDPKEAVLRALMATPGFVDRWTDHVMDALKVPRIEVQSMRTCYGVARREIDDGALAAFVRDYPGAGGGDGLGPFTMLDLLRSALVLDDLSPVYRAHLFALVSRPIPAANVPRVQAELARREDFGLVFDAAYLNRDIVCLACHTSPASVTEHPDPEQNRHWPLPGNFEGALYGDPFGIEPERAHAPFRFDGFVASGDAVQHRPWDWSQSCGGFRPSGLPADPAGIDGLFGTLSGDRLTVYDLEAALARGFAAIAGQGITIAADGTIADPDAAFAYMVSAAIVESVWREVIGTGLTISNYFPRNEASRDLLHDLTESFVRSRFSLQDLLVEIMTTPYFNRLDPAAGCGEGPYNMPAVFDPWVVADADEELRRNGPGDAVAPLSARTLMRAAYEALEWRRPYFMVFPEQPRSINDCGNQLTCAQMESLCASQGSCCLAHDFLCENPPSPGEPTAFESRTFQRGIGVFLKNGERGFRGLDFQARLVYEDRFGSCRNPTDQPDFIDAVHERAVLADSSLGEVVAAVKDRLVGQARVSTSAGPAGVSELDAIEALFGASLQSSAADVTDLNGRLRALCGVLMSSPQFLLSGLAPPDGAYVPELTPAEFGYTAICAEVAERWLDPDLSLTCGPGSLSVD